MRSLVALVLCSSFAVTLLGCSDVPPFWAKLGITAKGGETRKDMASDQFLVVFYDRDAAQLASTCKEAYEPIVTAGWTPVAPEPGNVGGKLEQVLKSGNDSISITCMNLAEVKKISVTYRHR